MYYEERLSLHCIFLCASGKNTGLVVRELAKPDAVTLDHAHPTMPYISLVTYMHGARGFLCRWSTLAALAALYMYYGGIVSYDSLYYRQTPLYSRARGYMRYHIRTRSFCPIPVTLRWEGVW